MLKLINNFKSKIEKEHNLIEAICISNSEGIIFVIDTKDTSITKKSKSTELSKSQILVCGEYS